MCASSPSETSHNASLFRRGRRHKPRRSREPPHSRCRAPRCRVGCGRGLRSRYLRAFVYYVLSQAAPAFVVGTPPLAPDEEGIVGFATAGEAGAVTSRRLRRRHGLKLRCLSLERLRVIAVLDHLDEERNGVAAAFEPLQSHRQLKAARMSLKGGESTSAAPSPSGSRRPRPPAAREFQRTRRQSLLACRLSPRRRAFPRQQSLLESSSGRFCPRHGASRAGQKRFYEVEYVANSAFAEEKLVRDRASTPTATGESLDLVTLFSGELRAGSSRAALHPVRGAALRSTARPIALAGPPRRNAPRTLQRRLPPQIGPY